MADEITILHTMADEITKKKTSVYETKEMEMTRQICKIFNVGPNPWSLLGYYLKTSLHHKKIIKWQTTSKEIVNIKVSV